MSQTYQGVVQAVDCHDARITIRYREGGRYGWVTQHDFPLGPHVRVHGTLHRGVLVTLTFEGDNITIREGHGTPDFVAAPAEPSPPPH